MATLISLGPYVGFMIVVWLAYSFAKVYREKSSKVIKAAAVEAGLTEPSSLHPVIDPAKCLGCATCVRACPEKTVLGIIDGKAHLVEPTSCIGHGACKTACPTGAIRLVFGTAERGLDLPRIGPDFQTNVPGIFIAGELGGMGLIRNAVEQGRQAVESIVKLKMKNTPPYKGLIIVGAGPAGFSAALAAKQHGLEYLVVEQDDLGGTVFKYPRGKVVMTAPAKLPIVGSMNFRKVSKEELLAFWQGIEKQQSLKVRYNVRVDSIVRTPEGFELQTNDGKLHSKAVLLAIGRRGTPRRLDVPGEEQKKVVYHLIDPEQYRGQHVLVVGGGDSALEAATSIADQEGSVVTLSYRGDAFGRAKAANREKANEQSASGQLRLMLKSKIKAIGLADVQIEYASQLETLRNDAVIVCAGGILPTEFLKSAGVEMETKYGTA